MSKIDIHAYEKLPRSFYVRDDVVMIARELLGKYLMTNIADQVTIAKIVETEAYHGLNDKACHAFMKRTPRTEVMYGRGGTAYVYLCYGIHHLFNVVTNEEGLADAVLIRALEPVEGLELMKKRTDKASQERIASGPGMLSKAMGISVAHNKASLLEEDVWIAEKKEERETFDIEADARIGVDYAGEDALLPWRFFIKGNRYISKGKKKP
ncbi:DNA-3-methyladenine glycosylase [Marinoscillum sp. MHG1-6]|uniref:DNA-3-methyladenine glycosylase n=1 Tax=Marinoscillum sp. MHG1-6 TaxID=2959627 RepID=UPI002157DF35|nr:DNA-3-methyladenine glycosylase [Marinoscillum sp. MHG1-6]